jgi:hypothetical protein
MAEATQEEELLTPSSRCVILTCTQRIKSNLKTTQNSKKSLPNIGNAKVFNNVLYSYLAFYKEFYNFMYLKQKWATYHLSLLPEFNQPKS